MSDDLIRQHVRKVLGALEAEKARLASRIEELESHGGRIIGGGQTDNKDCWEITDYRTGKVLAEGRGRDQYAVRAEELGTKYPGGIWHIDSLSNDVGFSGLPATSGVPRSLGIALFQWVEADTSDEDIAEWTGLAVEKVHEIRAEP